MAKHILEFIPNHDFWQSKKHAFWESFIPGLILSFIALIIPPIYAQPAPWPMYQHGPQHTGRSEYVGPQTSETNKLCLKNLFLEK